MPIAFETPFVAPPLKPYGFLGVLAEPGYFAQTKGRVAHPLSSGGVVKGDLCP